MTFNHTYLANGCYISSVQFNRGSRKAFRVGKEVNQFI